MTYPSKQKEYRQKYDKKYSEQNKEIRNIRTKKWREDHREYDRRVHKRRNERYREEMFSNYGDHCVCCNEIIKGFLTIDHINLDGQRHRRELGTGLNFLVSLKRLGWPKAGLRILCMNCNWGTRMGNPCPHELDKMEKST